MLLPQSHLAISVLIPLTLDCGLFHSGVQETPLLAFTPGNPFTVVHCLDHCQKNLTEMFYGLWISSFYIDCMIYHASVL